MGPKDETSAKAAEIGDGLIESLGFEPADGKKMGRSAVAEVSDQLSEAGFSVTDALDEPSVSNGDTKTAAKDGSVSGNGTKSKTSKSDGDDVDRGSDGDGESADIDSGANGSSRSGSSRSGSTPKSDSKSAGKRRSATDSDSETDSDSGVTVAAAATAASAAISAKVKQAEKKSAGTDNGLDVVPFTPGAKPPTGPPTADSTTVSPIEAPASPAVTGELPRVEATPTVVEQQPVVVDSRTIVDRPKSVSDLFSGGITGRRRLQARKVRRVIRHIDPWSVLTFSVMFHLCLFAALLLASALVFNVAEEAGTIENLESFIRELGDYETFEIDGQAIFKAAVAIAGIMTLAASVLVVLLTVMFNLLSDLLGGVRITVIEEETVRVKPKKDDAE